MIHLLSNQKRATFFWIGVLFLVATPAHAQLNTAFGDMFNFFLREQLQLNSDSHGEHYFPSATRANSELTPALNSMIASNISSFPLSSTTAGVTFDFSSGRPERITESLGPIFAEKAETIGKGKINLGVSYTYLSMDTFRGLSLGDMSYTFTHQDISPETGELEPEGSNSLGYPAVESDFMVISPNLDINSSIFAFYFTAGITDNLDIGIALPIIQLSMEGTATAAITSFTFGQIVPDNPDAQGAAHRFGGSQLNPVLQSSMDYNYTTNGIGDIAVRLKYHFLKGTGINVATLVDVRIPTGDETNFLGTGDLNTRVMAIVSGAPSTFNPHLNIGYDSRGGSLDSDEVEFVLGFDQKLSDTFTLAAEVLGTFDLNEDEAIVLSPGSVEIVEFFNNDSNLGQAQRVIDLSNIPDQSFDNTLDLAFGFRAAPSDKISLMGNVLIPLNDDGLRSSVVPTIAVNISI